ncbi:hypothetical protein HID58_093881, partial [Brassica napus]
MSASRFIKCVTVGDGAVGLCPTVFDTLVPMWLAGDYNRLRPLSYRGADVFILAFSLISKASYENVSKKWIPELKHYAPGVPIVLLEPNLIFGMTNSFLSTILVPVPITTAQGEELKNLIEAPAYIECSSKITRDEKPCGYKLQNVKGVFDAAIRVVLHLQSRRKKKNNAQKACFHF